MNYLECTTTTVIKISVRFTVPYTSSGNVSTNDTIFADSDKSLFLTQQ